MNNSSADFQQSKIGKIIFILTIAAAIYWIIGKSINVYSTKIGGAIFELLWLPSLIIICVLPIASFILWVNEKFNLRSLHLYSIILAVIMIITMIILS